MAEPWPTSRIAQTGSTSICGPVHGALESLDFDPGRAVLWAGSYGGYMTLAGLAFEPELWAAGVDLVGISNLVTFLQNTSGRSSSLTTCSGR